MNKMPLRRKQAPKPMPLLGLFVPLAPVWLLACGDPSPKAAEDAGPSDAGQRCATTLPAPSDPCLEDQCGNEYGVGQPCTRGGNECAGYELGEAIFCSADFSDTSVWFCTKPCSDDVDCGSDAICEQDPDDPLASKGCVLQRCAQ